MVKPPLTLVTRHGIQVCNECAADHLVPYPQTAGPCERPGCRCWCNDPKGRADVN